MSFFLSPDDFAEEEEVQSFGYKRFGKWQQVFQLTVA